MNMIRCGIIGMGKMGKIRAREIFKNPHTELKAICDINRANMEDFKVKNCKNIDIFLSIISIIYDLYYDFAMG